MLIGIQSQQSLLESLRALTPEIVEDVEDMQALESITFLGAFSSGNILNYGVSFPVIGYIKSLFQSLLSNFL